MENSTRKIEDKKLSTTPYVDGGLVSLFLKMSPEERLQFNDHAVRTILELRNTFNQQTIDGRQPKRTA